MTRTVHQVAELTGVSIRTLHYYDEIGLLNPSETTEAGYRLYKDVDLARLQQILFLRELDFELKEIKAILDRPDFDKTEALFKQKNLLTLKRNRLNKLIKLVDETLKGESEMSFEEFDMSEIENAQKQYQAEAEERWGNTDAYKESAKKTKSYTKEDWAKIKTETDDIYKAFARNMDKSPASPEVQKLVADWQVLITKYFYKCSNEMLAGLGQMYIGDERFTKNIDKYGKGLAEFKARAIEEYCKAK